MSGHLVSGEGGHPWSTYTYDIVVREHEGVRDGEGNLIVSDRYGLKEPYCMWIPAHPPGQTEGEGHSVWVHLPEAENAPAEMRVKYAINDQCLTPNAQDFNLIVVDPLLQERAAIGKPWPDTTGVMHGVEDVDEDGQPDGIKVYEFTDDDPGGTWRVLWTAQAPCGTTTRYRRTHDAQRMLVANQIAVNPKWARYAYRYGTTDHAAAGATCREGDGNGAWVVGFWPGLLKMCWIGPDTCPDPFRQTEEHGNVATEALEFASSRTAAMSVWTKVKTDYLNLGNKHIDNTVVLAEFTDALDNKRSATFYESLGDLKQTWGPLWNCAHFAMDVLGKPTRLPLLPNGMMDSLWWLHRSTADGDKEWRPFLCGQWWDRDHRQDCTCHACTQVRAR